MDTFKPGEVSAEDTHEIGMQLTKEIMVGKYEFVLTNHIDKGHIHNHLIFDAISFTNHNRDRFNKRSYHEIHHTSDGQWFIQQYLCSLAGIPGQESYIEGSATTGQHPMMTLPFLLAKR